MNKKEQGAEEFRVLCITERKLCREPFVKRAENIASERPWAMILREKDLGEEEYFRLAEKIIPICRAYGVKAILHFHPKSALALGADGLHMPLPMLRQMTEEEKKAFGILGASCHSPEEAVEAERLGCTYVTAGHVFETDCKKELEPRGEEFLRAVCASVSIPVYGIGGILPENIRKVRAAGAAGACIRGPMMKTENPQELFRRLREGVKGI